MERLLRTNNFLKSDDGNHFYMKRDEDWLHVVVYREDGEYVHETEDGYWTAEYKKGECLINNIYVLNPDKKYLTSSEEEFAEAIRFAIFSLDVFRYTVPLKEKISSN